VVIKKLILIIDIIIYNYVKIMQNSIICLYNQTVSEVYKYASNVLFGGNGLFPSIF
jgi:hypothetical protein